MKGNKCLLANSNLHKKIETKKFELLSKKKDLATTRKEVVELKKEVTKLKGDIKEEKYLGEVKVRICLLPI